MKNSADQGQCYPQRPKAEVDYTLRDLQNSQFTFYESFAIHAKYSPVLAKEFCHFVHQKQHNI